MGRINVRQAPLPIGCGTKVVMRWDGKMVTMRKQIAEMARRTLLHNAPSAKRGSATSNDMSVELIRAPQRFRYKQGKQPLLKPDSVTLNLIMNLSGKGCTQAEIAGLLGVAEKTFTNFLSANPEAREALDRGGAILDGSLRAKQVELALDGDVTMLIWLGKQRLGQRDQRHFAAASTVTFSQTVDQTRAWLEAEGEITKSTEQ